MNALVGRRFRIGTVLCEGIRLCEPCQYLPDLVGNVDSLLIAPKPRNDVSGFELVPETRTNFAQKRIAQTVAKGIVELLEIVDV